MEAKEYQKLARKSASSLASDRDKALIVGALGLGGESGEAIDLVKKYLFHGHTDGFSAKMFYELGDILWYICLIADTLGYSLEAIMEGNIDKLTKRYPSGFSNEASKNRIDNE